MKKEANLQTISLIRMKKTISIITLIALIAMGVSGIIGETNKVYAQSTAMERSFPNANKSKDEEPTTLGRTACLIDAKTGYVVYGVDEHEKNYPASTTKILTALLAVENLDFESEVTVDKEAEAQGGSQLFLGTGEVLTVKNLLYGLMLPSANDAAVAIAKAVSPTTADFSDLMNERAKEAGAENSNFINPNGLPERGHYTTAYDLAMITKDALKHDAFREIVTTYEYTIPKTNMSVERLVHNRNRLLFDTYRQVEVYGETKPFQYEGVTGVKTGFTDEARHCLVASAKRGETEFIAVTLGDVDMNQFQDVISMLDYGFNNYKTVEVKAEGQSIDDIKVSGGKEKYAKASLKEGLYATIPKDGQEEDLEVKEFYNNLEAPYEEGIDGGTLEVYYKDEKVGQTDIVITSAMEEGSFIDDLKTGSGITGVITKILIVLLVLFVLILLMRIRNKNKRKRARKRRRSIESD